MAKYRDYLIAVKTGDVVNAGHNNDSVFITLAGTFGVSTRYALNASSNILCKEIGVPRDEASGGPANPIVPCTKEHDNKFERNAWDVFRIRTNDVGAVREIRVEKDGTDGWMLEKVVVIPYSYTENTENPYDLDQRRTFSINRWFDSADFDRLTDLYVTCDELVGPAHLPAPKRNRKAKTMVMRYDSAMRTEQEPVFTFNYSIVQGVAFDASQAKDVKTEHSTSQTVEVSHKATAGAEVGGLSASVETEFKYSGSYSFSNEVTKSCAKSFGATTTTTIEQSQAIPIRVPESGKLTLLVQVYQTALEYMAEYDGYKVPVTVYDGTVDMSFRTFEDRLLSPEEEIAESIKLATLAGMAPEG